MSFLQLLATLKVGFNLFIQYGLPILLVCFLVAFTLWLFSLACSSLKNTFQRNRRMRDKELFFTKDPGATSQPDTPVIADPKPAIADVPAAEDVQAEKHATPTVQEPVELQPLAEAPGRTWNEVLVLLPGNYFPAIEEQLYAPILTDQERTSFQVHPSLKFCTTDKLRSCHSKLKNLPVIAPTMEQLNKLKIEEILGGSPYALRIRSQRYPLDRNYETAVKAA